MKRCVLKKMFFRIYYAEKAVIRSQERRLMQQRFCMEVAE